MDKKGKAMILLSNCDLKFFRGVHTLHKIFRNMTKVIEESNQAQQPYKTGAIMDAED